MRIISRWMTYLRQGLCFVYMHTTHLFKVNLRRDVILCSADDVVIFNSIIHGNPNEGHGCVLRLYVLYL